MIKIYLHVHLILDWNRWVFRNLRMAFFAKWNMKWVTVVTISKKRPQRSSVVLNEASWHTLPLVLFGISLLPPMVWNWLFVAWFFILYPHVLSTFDKWLLGCSLIKNQKRMEIKERQKDEISKSWNHWKNLKLQIKQRKWTWQAPDFDEKVALAMGSLTSVAHCVSN